jgi:hypothetical protein
MAFFSLGHGWQSLSRCSQILLGACGLLVALPTNSLAASTYAAAKEVTATLPEIWRPASAEEEERLWDLVLQNPLGIAALNQLAIEGFIDPTCDRTWYTHVDYGSFQSLLQVQCPTQRGVNIAVGYDEMWVTFNRFEDNITAFEIERIYEDEAGLPALVAEAVLQAAAQESEVHASDLMIRAYERQTWSDSCLGLGGPAEICAAVLTEGWQVSVTDGQRTWVFRTNDDGSQVRLDPQA